MIPSMSFIELFYSFNIRTTSCSASTPDNLHLFHTPRTAAHQFCHLSIPHDPSIGSELNVLIPNDLSDSVLCPQEFAPGKMYSACEDYHFFSSNHAHYRTACLTLTTERQVSHSQSFDPCMSAYGVAKERNPWLCRPNIPAEVAP